MPEAEVYEEELRYMPYAKSLAKVVELVVGHAPKNGHLIDLMSGTGHLLGKIREQRPDLSLSGVDIDPRYVEFARRHHPGIVFNQGDVLSLKTITPVDVFTCTGSLHHIPYERQEGAVRNMAGTIKPEGFGIISDCYIDTYFNERERKLAAARLGYEYLRETIINGSTDEVTAVTADILKNDVMGVEFKTSLFRRLAVFEKLFGKVETFKTWPEERTHYGDFVTVLGGGVGE